MLGCTSQEYNTSNAARDQFGRVTSYDYEYKCADGSQRQSGRLSSIQ